MIYLLGEKMPSVELRSTTGEMINPQDVPGLCVYFCYPYIGNPIVPDPENWDNIPYAHGSTPQALAYSALFEEFSLLNVKVFGLSFQDHAWQSECVARLSLRWPLLSDHSESFADTLTLPIFETGGRKYLERVTLVAKNGILSVVRVPLGAPESDAWQILQMLGD